MSGATFSVANVQIALELLKARIPVGEWDSTPLPIIAAPQWWIDEVVRSTGQTGVVLDEVHHCKVFLKEEITEPVLVDHNGKVYPILPSWQRTSAQEQAVAAVADKEDGHGHADA